MPTKPLQKWSHLRGMCMCVCLCVRACVHACVRACVCARACMRACVRLCVRACMRACVCIKYQFQGIVIIHYCQQLLRDNY